MNHTGLDGECPELTLENPVSLRKGLLKPVAARSGSATHGPGGPWAAELLIRFSSRTPFALSPVQRGV